MKKRLLSLLVVLIVFVTLHMTLSSAVASLGELPSEEFLADFDSMEAGANYTDQEIEEASGVPMLFKLYRQDGTPIKAEIIEESDGNKYLNLNAVTEADEIESIYVLNTPLNVGKLEAGFEFSPARSGAGSWEFFEVNNAEYSGRADVENRGRTVYWSQEIAKASKIQEDTIHFKNPVRNAKGRYSLHYELSRMSPDDAWEVKIFDVAQVTPTLLYSGTYPKTFGAITQIELVRFYAGVGGWPIDLDNYYVKTTAFPEVTDDSECASLGSNVEINAA